MVGRSDQVEALTPRSVISRTADRMLHRTALAGPQPVSAEAAALHASVPVVDLLLGSAIMRPRFLGRRRRGHADLPRLREGGVDLVGLSIATRHPDLRGTSSTPFFWSQGLPRSVLGSDMAIAQALIDRIEGWARGSGEALRIVRGREDLDLVGPASGWLGAFLGVQGGHVLEGDVSNLERLHERGVRMLALAHVMDNALVGSNTGAERGGLKGLGREVIAECERLGILVDLAHMSNAGIREALPLLTRPFVLSHTGFTQLAGGGNRRRRYSPGTRNLPSDEARLVAEAGGVIGVTLSTWLLGGDDLGAVGRAFDLALEIAGPTQVAIGSDMDGGLRMVVDAAGMPALTDELLRRGHDTHTVEAVMGGNALRVLRAAYTDPRATAAATGSHTSTGVALSKAGQP
jgi:microsomal dipeptidase-like Zn-dependent dipeptidase